MHGIALFVNVDLIFYSGVDCALLEKAVACFSHMFNRALHQEPPASSLLRSIIMTMIPLYTRGLARAVKVGFVESGAVSGTGIAASSQADRALEHFRSAIVLKDQIVRVLLPSAVKGIPGHEGTTPPHVLTRLCTLISDSCRISIIKLVESLIVAQSNRTAESSRSAHIAISLDQIPDLPNSLLNSIVEASTAASSATTLPGICLVRPRRLADEADRLFAGLSALPSSSASPAMAAIITGPVFDAIIDCLVSIASQRPQFLDRAVQTFETVHVNLPQHFSQVQVGSARQKLKQGLLSLLQQPSAVAEYKSRITILLTDLGATQTEVRNEFSYLCCAFDGPIMCSSWF